MKVNLKKECSHCNCENVQSIDLHKYIMEICLDKADPLVTINRMSKMIGLVINDLCDNGFISNSKITDMLHEITHDKTITVTQN